MAEMSFFVSFHNWSMPFSSEACLGRLEPSGRGGPVIFAEAAGVYATAEEARNAAAKRLEGELEQVRGMGAE